MADNSLFVEHTPPVSAAMPEQGAQEQGSNTFEQRTNQVETVIQPAASSGPRQSTGVLLDQLRQGPLAAASVPTAPVATTELDQIKQLLFPGMDVEKATPQELVTYLLINHELHPEQAHKWVEFLAQTHEPQA